MNKKAADVVEAVATAGLANVARVPRAWRRSRMKVPRAANASFQAGPCYAEKEGRLVLARVGPEAKERAVIAVALGDKLDRRNHRLGPFRRSLLPAVINKSINQSSRRHCNDAVRSFDIQEAIVAILRLTLMEDTIMV